MAYSLEHCRERVTFFQAEYDANQRRATEALKQLDWWHKEQAVAQREAADKASHQKAA